MWLFIEPWTVWYPITALGSMLTKSQTTAQNNVIPLCGKYMRLQEVLQNLFLPIMRLEYGGMLVSWLFIEPWTLWYTIKALGSIPSKSSLIQH